MTTEQEHLITLLFVKHGTWQEVVDAWLYPTDTLSPEEYDAIEAWLATDRAKPDNIQVVNDSKYPHLTVEIDLK